MVGIDRLLDFAATLPEVGEHERGGPTTMVTFRGRAIAWVTERDDGEVLVVKATLADREVLLASEPDVYAPSWASGRFGWVEVRLGRVDAREACELLAEAWRLTAPRRLATAHDVALPD